MNKWTYPQEPLTWGNLEKIISRMSSAQKEREVLGYGFTYKRGDNSPTDVVVKLRKLLVTTEEDREICDPDQPILLF